MSFVLDLIVSFILLGCTYTLVAIGFSFWAEGGRLFTARNARPHAPAT